MKTLWERFEEKICYEPMSGCWLWMGCVSGCGYGYFLINRINKRAHRLAWEITRGEIPDKLQIDHICHNKICVNPEHLRLATHAQNIQNQGITSKNKSGFKGVSYDKGSGRWIAKIMVSGTLKHLGRFTSLEEAHAAYCDAAKRLCGQFANLG
jgi:hypothetical protein